MKTRRPRIAVIDYGAGNLRSICRALSAVGAVPEVSADPLAVRTADGVVLPGVGAAGASMERLRESALVAPLHAALAAGKPFLGVCLGMQLLYGHQEEGDTEGLGVLPGRVRSLGPGVKVPQIGWNRVRLVADGPLGRAGDDYDAYFVHSFIAEGVDPVDVVALSRYGEVFPSVVARGAVWGTQFHPEKSGDAGLGIVRTWVGLANVGEPLAPAAAEPVAKAVPA
ncbi:MAG: imidazole glycerol phosphate synthase subunit HisH [Chloroflexia bacterium]|nr:imidazole glycerol phosphate synthase subunit HisH [Chloroflexia bacterium]